MRVLEYSAHNVLRLRDITFDMAGRNLFIVGGKNEEGKSSSLKALLIALCGRSGMDFPEIALKQGETEGWVKVSLSGDDDLQDNTGFTVELLLKKERSGQVVEKFRLLDSTGEPAPEPRALLKRLYDLRAFDPLAFERMDKKAQRDLLSKVVGLDFTEQKAEHDKLYKERTDVNKDGTKLKAKFDLMPNHPGVKAVDTAELFAEMEKRRIHNTNRAQKAAELLAATNRHASFTKEIGELETQLASLKANLKATVASKGQLEQELEVQPIMDVDALRAQLTSADEMNQKAAQNAARTAAQKDLDELREQSGKLTERMAAIMLAIQVAIANAKWPIAGLGLDDDGVLYDGLPFEQASRSVRIRTSVKIGMSLNPKLRLMVSEHGNDLDQDALAELDKMLAESDFQFVLELVTRTPADEALCAVVIEDGAVKSSNTKG